MEITQRPRDGADIARVTIKGMTFEAVSANGATMALARKLVAAGFGDSPWEAVGRDGKRRLFGPSLHRLARLTIRDDARAGLRVEAFRSPSSLHHGYDKGASMPVRGEAVEAPCGAGGANPFADGRKRPGDPLSVS